MSWVAIIFMTAFALAAVLLLHTFLHFRKHLKDLRPHEDGPLGRTLKKQEKPVPKFRDDAPKPDRLLPAVEEGAHEALGMQPVVGRSMNDVHRLREQDQALAQLAAQYDDMAKEPWEVITSGNGTVTWPGDIRPKTFMRAQALILSFMMTPPSVGGAQRGISARETLHFLNVGNQKVVAASKEAAEKVQQQLNDSYFATISGYRSSVIAGIHALALKQDPVLEYAPGTMYAVCCGQTQVWFDTAENAGLMCKALNEVFKPVFDAERRRILDEIAEVAA